MRQRDKNRVYFAQKQDHQMTKKEDKPEDEEKESLKKMKKTLKIPAMMQVYFKRFDLCLLTTVAPYVFWLTLVFLYLGTLVLTSQLEEHPPSFGLPRILFMVAVAILVERREGVSSSLRQTHSLMFETILTITVCNLALALVWDQIEKMVHIVLAMLSRIAELASGRSLACGTCGSFHPLQFVFTTLVAATLLSWVLLSVARYPLLDRSVSKCISRNDVTLRFWPLVEVRFINPGNHIPEYPTEQELRAPTGGGRNPVARQHANFPKINF